MQTAHGVCLLHQNCIHHASPQVSETEAVNPDSFLDIVASVVSIMIIMVLMTGLKIKHTPLVPALAIRAQPPMPN